MLLSVVSILESRADMLLSVVPTLVSRVIAAVARVLILDVLVLTLLFVVEREFCNEDIDDP